ASLSTFEGLRALATELRAFLLAHPRLAGLLASRPIRGATFSVEAPASDETALAIDSVVGLVVGLTLAEIAGRGKADAGGATDVDRLCSYALDTLSDGLARRREDARGISP